MSPVDRDVVRRKLTRIVKCLSRIAGIRSRKVEEAAPADAHTSFLEVARDARALDADLAARLAPSTGLRSRLAHVYEDLDPALVYAGLNEALELYPRYVEAIEAYLERA
jgi:uncharacterized protein YutE (UPF0331/DUF86 family)